MTTGEDLAAALAREIRAAVAETAPAEPPAPGEPSSDDLADVRLPLKRAEQYLTPTIPDASRLAGVKSAAVRLLRFLWRGQSSFNALVLEAENGVVAALERNSSAADRAAKRIEDVAEEFSRWRKEWEKEHRQRDAKQDHRIAYLEALSSRSSPASSAVVGEAPLPESVYALFEERFRGSAEEVREKQTFYLPFLWNLPGPVFDAGCGRGEFLQLLKDQGIPSRGVDSSGLAAETCRAAGLDVRQGDAVDALAAVPSESLGGVVAFQVVEHWPAAATFRFLAEARRALAPGGVAIVETVNTDSLAAMNAFYLDPTHVRPVPPEALRFLFDAAGFRDLRVEYLSPIPASERLEERSGNDARLNSVLFGPQDYAVLGWVPAA
ncbi:MAG TPA: class I SAM-dependent methyltransferase [Thermoanaerobaculia bacterium]